MLLADAGHSLEIVATPLSIQHPVLIPLVEGFEDHL
jgi:hypothetical protein